MAIKTLSMLKTFDNKIYERGDQVVGGELTLFQNENENDKKAKPAIATRTTPGIALSADNSKYHGTIFEIAVPVLPGAEGYIGSTDPLIYDTYKITYSDLVKNIILDTKSYLNTRNYLSDFNINAIVNDTYTFKGDKTLNGSLTVTNRISSSTGIITNLTSTNITNTNLTSTNITNTNLTSTNITNTNLTSTNITNTNLTSTTATISRFTKPLSLDFTDSSRSILTSDLTLRDVLVATMKSNSGAKYNIPIIQSFSNDANGIGTVFGSKGTTIIRAGESFDYSHSIASPFNAHNSEDMIFTADNDLYLYNHTNYGAISDSSKELSNRFSIQTNKEKVIIGGLGGSEQNKKREVQIYGSLKILDESGKPGVILSSNGECTLTASAARWSDLAEYYFGDKPYGAGTLVEFGGEKEITIAKKTVNAIVTSKPAYLMNAGLKKNPNGVAIALSGRIPVRITGAIIKGQKITLSSTPGVARCKKWYDIFKPTIGIALETSLNTQEKLVECVTNLKL